MKVENTTRAAILFPSGHRLEPGETGDVPEAGDNANFFNGQFRSGRIRPVSDAVELKHEGPEDYPDFVDGDV